MSKPKVYVTRKIYDEGLNLLREHVDIEVYEGNSSIPRDLLLEKVADVDGLLCLLTDKIDAELINSGKTLKVISNYAVGYNNIDTTTATEKGIYVTNTPGVLTDTTADYAFALLMSVARRVVEADKYIRRGDWKTAWGPKMYTGGDVWGKTLGIIGFGRIGQAMGRRGLGFNMKVIYNSANRKPELEEEMGVEWGTAEEVLRKSDFVSIHVPLTPQTEGMIGKRELDMMKETAYLVNTSRGPVVDEKALYEALKERKLAGAGLDVFHQEPVNMDNPLLTLDNLVVAPHIASASVESRTKMSVMNAKDILNVLQGRNPVNLVNPEVKKVRPL